MRSPQRFNKLINPTGPLKSELLAGGGRLRSSGESIFGIGVSRLRGGATAGLGDILGTAEDVGE